MPCSTLYWEFTMKLLFSSDLIYQIYIYQCMKEHNRKNTKNHNTRYNVVHPQCRGYVHRTLFYSTFLQNHNSDLRTQLQIPSVLKAMHTAAGLYAHSYRFPYHLQTLCTHSCRGRPCTQLGLNLLLQNSLNFALILLSQKA